MKKGLIFATTLAMALGVGVAVGAHQAKAPVKAEAISGGDTVYLDPGVWSADNAWFALYTFGSAENWVKMEPVGGTGVYSATLNASNTSMIFCRMNPSKTALNWDSKWDQSRDLTYSEAGANNQYSVTGWGENDGEWGTYVEPEYHLVGDFNEWTAAASNLLTVDPEDANHYSISGVEMEKDNGLKIHDTANDEWFDNGAGNIIVSESGTYDVDFYVHVEYGDPIVLTKQVTPVVYSVKYGSSSFEFALDDEHKPDGADHQYKATLSEVYIFYAKKLEFFADGVKMTDIGVDYDMEKGEPVPGNNIVGDVTNGFKVHTPNTGMDVYMKQYGSWFSLWGAGYAENSFDLTYDASSLGTLSVDSEFEPYGDYVKQYKTSSAVSLSKLNAAQEQNNYYISDSLGASVAIALETAGENNAVAKGTGSIYFDVHNDCNAVVYLKEKADLSLVLYIGGYEEAHVITIGGKNVTLHKVAENKYAATGVSLTAGDTVTAYTIEGVTQTVSAEVVGNNNLDAAKKVLVTNTSADIYFNTQTSELWVSGLPDGGYHLYKNSSSVVLMVETEDYGEYHQWKTESVSFAVGDTVEILDTNGKAGDKGPVIWTITEFEESPMSDNFEVKDGKIKCKTACITSVYLKLKYEDDRIYFGAEAQYITDAREYANGFKSAMAECCAVTGESKKATVEAAWAAQANAFNKLAKEARDELIRGGESSVAEVREFAERYCGIYEQGDFDLDNFLKWDIEPSVRYYNGFDAAGDNTTMIIIIAVAATSALAFGVLLLIKKRKHN